MIRPRAARRITVALLALIVSMGGTAYAAVVVTTKEVKDRSLLGKDLKKNTLTSTEIDESQLQIASANGVVPLSIYWTEPPIQPAGGVTILALNGLTLRASCSQSETTLTASTVSSDAEIAWIARDADGAPNGVDTTRSSRSAVSSRCTAPSRATCSPVSGY